MNIKKTVYIGCILLSGCSLNIPLEDQFSDPDAITDALAARSLLLSAYASLPQYQFELSVLSDDFYPTQYLVKQPDLQMLYQWREINLTDFAETVWTNYYATVALCNALLGRIGKIQAISGEEEKQLLRIESESRILKAKCYFDLLRIFAPRWEGNADADGIILKDRLELDFIARSSLSKCVDEIRRLLTEAMSAENKPEVVHWLSAHSAAYLLAELELYSGNYDGVIAATEELITVYTEQVLSRESYENLWGENACDERIFAKYELEPFYKDITFDYSKGDFLMLNDELIFEEEDIRKKWSEYSFAMNNRQVRLFGKYNALNYETKKIRYINNMRVAGIYLMRAEALARTAHPQLAVRLMNCFLARRGAELWDEGLREQVLIEKIIAERRREFVGEGERYFDLKRCAIGLKRYTEYGTTVMSEIKVDDYRWTLPIPANEYRYNANVSQNLGWEKIGL